MFKPFIVILFIHIGNMDCGKGMLIEQIAGRDVVRKADTVFPFARKGDAAYAIETSSPAFKRLNDFEPGDKTLEELSLEISIKSGIPGIFGSKNVLSLTDRSLNQNEEGFKLKSTLIIEA